MTLEKILDRVLENSELGEFERIETTKVLLDNFSSEPHNAAAVLEALLRQHPQILERKLKGSLYLEYFNDVISRAISYESVARCLVLVASALMELPSLYKEIPRQKTYLFNIIKEPDSFALNYGLIALLKLPLTIGETAEACRIARRYSDRLSRDTVVAILNEQTNDLWIQFLVEYAFAGGDATFSLQLLLYLLKERIGVTLPTKAVGPVAQFMREVLEGHRPHFSLEGQERLLSEVFLEIDRRDHRLFVFDENTQLDPEEVPEVLYAALETRISQQQLEDVIHWLTDFFRPQSTLPMDLERENLDESWICVLARVFEHELLLTSTELRLDGLELLRLAFTSFAPPVSLSFENTIGSWIIGCIKSSNRVLRLKAVSLMPCFVKKGMSNEDFMELFRQCGFRRYDIIGRQYETQLHAWAALSIVCEGDHLNFLLLRFVDQLCTNESIKIALATTLLKFIATEKQTHVHRLFSPFWRTVAPYMVKRLPDESGISKLCMLCEISVDTFLKRTTEFTVPYLWFQQRYDVLERLAKYDGISLQKLYEIHAGPIGAFLLTRKSDEPQEFAERKWRSLKMPTHTFRSWVVKHKAQTDVLIELIKMDYMDLDETKLVKAIEYIYDLKEGDTMDKDAVFKLAARLTQDICQHRRGRLSTTAKISYIHGIDFMIRRCPIDFGVVRNQIFTLLQSQMENRDTTECALVAWKSMLVHLGGRRVVHFLNLTASIIAQKHEKGVIHWRCLDIVEALVADSDIRQYIASHGLPGLPAALQELVNPYVTERPQLSKLEQIVDRCEDENVYVVRETLQDLGDFMYQNQNLIQDVLLRQKQGIKLIEKSLKTALYTHAADSQLYAANLLGQIGAVDPYRINIYVSSETPTLIHNFANLEESHRFVAYLIQHYLLKELESTAKPDAQLLAGFEIQELLKFCGFSADHVDENLWNSLFKYSNHDLLRPFLNTKYRLGSHLSSNFSYPIHQPSMRSRDWLIRLTYDLMSRPTTGNAALIFSQVGKLFRENSQFENIAEFFLPYAVMNAILSDEVARNNIIQEFLTVLEFTGPGSSGFHNLVFQVIDYCTRWIRYSRASAHRLNNEIGLVEQFLSAISGNLMAQRALDCQLYPRAVRYWEQCVRSSSIPDEVVWENFRKMYTALGDNDSLEGISAKFGRMTLDQHILEYKSTGDWDSAIACYNIKLEEWDFDTFKEVLECYQESGRHEQVLARLEEVSPKTPQIVEIAIESAWRIESWKKLERWTRLAPHSSQGLLGRALLNFRDGNPVELKVCLDAAKDLAMNEIRKHTVTSLNQIRSSEVLLHGLSDFERIAQQKFTASGQDQNLSKILTKRLQNIGPSFEVRDFLLSLRRILFSVSGLNSSKEEVGISWLESARQARKSGNLEQAVQCALHAEKSGHPLGIKEHAKVLWKKNQQIQAIRTLRSQLDDQFLNKWTKCKSVKPLNYCKNALLYTRWLDASGYATSTELIERYNAIMVMHPKWEKVYYRLARHKLKILESQRLLKPESRNEDYYDGSLIMDIVDNLANTVCYGMKYVNEALPKLITLWLDFSDFNPKSYSDQVLAVKRVQNIKSMTFLIDKVSQRKRIPAYVWYQGLPQLLSRVSHKDSHVFAVIKNIILRVLQTFPAQSIWSLVEVYNSSSKERAARGKQILREAMALNPDISSAQALISELKELCSMDMRARKTKATTMSVRIKSVPCKSVVVPTQTMLHSTLPLSSADPAKHPAFDDVVYFHSVDECVHIMPSLQKPKRIEVWGTDGKKYALLCKGRDDVRKDSRLMQFIATINRLLDQDSMAASKRLKVKSYQVTPLSEDTGLIEWVDGAIPLRKIIETDYRARKIGIQHRTAQQMLDKSSDAQRVANFEQLVRLHPAVLYDWFIHTFSDPNAWLEARNLYAKSTAVMSMVGYILGLGDRHLENILIIENSGSVLHVDFDCLFDKGTTFAIPEVVPFRLTHNMVDAFGAQGYEGPFRKACETTLQLLHDHENLLMTVLEPFVHDPVVASEQQQRRGQTPQEALDKIKNRIMGIKVSNMAPLSVSGQVEDLIKMATSPERLSRMYVGWCAFI